MKIRLIWKIVAINVLAVAIVVVTVGLAIRFLAANYFMTLVEQYNISPEKANKMFLDAVQRYLALASVAGCVASIGLSVWLARRALWPLTQMTQSAGHIAAGNYAVRISASQRDEVGELAAAFNGMADSLVRIDQMRKDLVSNVAHELRTPLTNIRGYLEGLIDEVVPPSLELFESLHEETLRLAKLVEDLLHLARADAARHNLNLERIHLGDLLSQSLELFQLRFREKQISVETSLPAAEIMLEADAPKLVQVLTNLLENAWRYTPVGGHLKVSAGRAPSGVRVLIVNTCDVAAQPRADLIFERFYRAEPSRSRELGGAGIGLAIVKELVEAHGGSVGCETTSNQILFWFQLPIHRKIPPAGASN